jgi:hypothetical protein
MNFLEKLSFASTFFAVSIKLVLGTARALMQNVATVGSPELGRRNSLISLFSVAQWDPGTNQNRP